jgi:hypothetical protein
MPTKSLSQGTSPQATATLKKQLQDAQGAAVRVTLESEALQAEVELLRSQAADLKQRAGEASTAAKMEVAQPIKSSYEQMVVQKLEALQAEVQAGQVHDSTAGHTLIAIVVGVVGGWISLMLYREFGVGAAGTAGVEPASPAKDVARMEEMLAKMEEMESVARKTHSLLQKDRHKSKQPGSTITVGGSPPNGGVLKGGVTFAED